MQIRPLEKEEAAEAAQPVYEQLERKSGKVSNFFKTLAHKPDVLQTFVPFMNAVMGSGALSRKFKELAYLRVSIINGCDY
jgi:alkylhydroperoxidase family enzyme